MNKTLSIDRKKIEKKGESKQKETIKQTIVFYGDVREILPNLKKQGYDFGVFSSIGSGISKTYESMIMISQSENFKMFVLDSSSVGPAQIQPLLKLKQLVEKEKMDLLVIVKKKV